MSTTSAVGRLHAQCHREGSERLHNIAIGIGPLALSDALEILARIATLCTDHTRCGGCGATFCETCGIGEPGYCGHGHPRCADCWPAPECRDCQDIADEAAVYDQRDKPIGVDA